MYQEAVVEEEESERRKLQEEHDLLRQSQNDVQHRLEAVRKERAHLQTEKLRIKKAMHLSTKTKVLLIQEHKIIQAKIDRTRVLFEESLRRTGDINPETDP